MTESTADATLELLRRMRAEVAENFAKTEARFIAIDARFDRVDRNIGLLADGLLNVRVEMKNLSASLDTVAISTASHGIQLSDLEERIARIEKHLNIPQ